MSYVGTTEIGKMFLGSVEIDKAYLGMDLVFNATPSNPLVFYNYLYFDGSAIIETNYTLPSTASFSVPLGHETNKAAQRVFRVLAGTGSIISFQYTSSTTTARRQFGVYYGSSSQIGGNRNLAFSTTDYNFFFTPKRYGYGSTAYTISKGSGYPTGVLCFGGWLTDTGNPYSGRMGTFCVYGSDAQNATTYSGITAFTPEATFRPCTYYGAAGMWYVEGNTFFGNSASSGTLTASNS